MSATVTATFGSETFTRRTEHAYPFASRDERGTVRFHSTEAAAKRAAGRFGDVVRTDAPVADTSPAGDVWVATFADGSTATVTTDRFTPPHVAAKRARPDVPFVSARRADA